MKESEVLRNLIKDLSVMIDFLLDPCFVYLLAPHDFILCSLSMSLLLTPGNRSACLFTPHFPLGPIASWFCFDNKSIWSDGLTPLCFLDSRSASFDNKYNGVPFSGFE